jgi:hypothetical protein
MLFMAWSPVRRTNAGRFEVDHPGDYATLNSYHPSDATRTQGLPVRLQRGSRSLALRGPWELEGAQTAQLSQHPKPGS